MKKRILSLILIVMLLISSIPFTALPVSAATSGTCGTDVRWSLDVDSGVLTISGSGNMNYYRGVSPYFAPWDASKSFIKKVVVEEGVLNIGACSFYNCSSIESITLPESVGSIGNHAFYNCSSLTSINIPNNIKSIDNYVFYNCSSLNNIDVPNSVKSIGMYAFYNCKSLKNLSIGFGLKSIDISAFSGCNSLHKVIYNGSSQQWSEVSVGGNSNLTGEIIISYGNCGDNLIWTFDVNSGTLRISGTGEITSSPWQNKYVKNIIIGHGVTSIGEGVFKFCSELEKVSISNTVTIIEDSAFSYCTSLKNITLPNSVTRIGNYAFSNCSNLKESLYLGSSEEWSNISVGWYNHNIEDTVAFLEASCGDNVSWTVDMDTGTLIFSGEGEITNTSWSKISKYINTVIINDGVTGVAEYAFSNNNSLKIVVIPDSMKNIGDFAFHVCRSLSHVFYSGTEKQWSKINFGSNTDGLNSATIHYECGNENPITDVVNENCTSDGSCEVYCSICQTVISQIAIPANGHNFENEICSDCGKREDFIESSHPYEANFCETKYIYEPNAKFIGVVFSDETEVEEEYDFIRIYNNTNELIGEYTGKELSGKRIVVHGNMVRVCLVSDKNYTYYGYAVADVEYYYDDCTHANAEIIGVVEPDCTTIGSTGELYCTICEYRQTAIELPALGHDYENGICARCGDELGYVYGDADGDNDITTRDVLLIRKHLGGLVNEDNLNVTAADVDLDGDLTTRDVLAIRKYLGGLIDELPVK